MKGENKMREYEKPIIIGSNGQKGDVKPTGCNVCLVGGVVAAVWNVGAVWNVAVAAVYAVGALVVIKGLGPEC